MCVSRGVQIRQLFAFCGSVIGCDFVGDENMFLLVEYATAKVTATLGMLLTRSLVPGEHAGCPKSLLFSTALMGILHLR